ncbi:MAG: hypothetical protein ACFFBQ_20110 [Promethearchaeota archaeon]
MLEHTLAQYLQAQIISRISMVNQNNKKNPTKGISFRGLSVQESVLYYYIVPITNQRSLTAY